MRDDKNEKKERYCYLSINFYYLENYIYIKKNRDYIFNAILRRNIDSNNFVNTRLLRTNINKDYLIANIVGIFNIYPYSMGYFIIIFRTVNNFHSLFYRGNGK